MKIKSLLFLMGSFLLLFSCGINSDIMFRTKGAVVIKEDIPISPQEAYRLAPDDQFMFTISVNDGKRLIDMQSGAEVSVVPGSNFSSNAQGNRIMNQRMGIDYLIQPNGLVALPVVGEVNLVGLTIKEAQDKLQELYSSTYNKPFIQLEVTNRRVIVFPGSGGAARVVPIMNNNTTLIEAIAMSGGVTPRGKVKKIKVMRKEDNQRLVYEIDLRTLEGLKYADMVVQANDIIYVQPVPQINRELLAEITPVLSLLTSGLFIYSIFNN